MSWVKALIRHGVLVSDRIKESFEDLRSKFQMLAWKHINRLVTSSQPSCSARRTRCTASWGPAVRLATLAWPARKYWLMMIKSHTHDTRDAHQSTTGGASQAVWMGKDLSCQP